MERKISLRHPDLAHGASAAKGLSLVMPSGSRREQGISWAESTDRVTAYWRALGVTDEDHLTALTRKVMQRVDALEPENTTADLATLSIEETRRMLDEWLAKLLGIDHEVSLQELAAARAALLSGAVAGWPAALLGADQPALVGALRKALIVPVPAAAKLTMEAQQIKLLPPLSPVALAMRCLYLLRVGAGKLLAFIKKR